MLDNFRRVSCKLIGDTPLSFSRFHDAPQLTEKETKEAYDERTWREKCHYDDVEGSKTFGQCYIKPDAFKQSLEATAKYLGEKVKGKGQSTFTARFLGGIYVNHGIFLTSNGKPVMINSPLVVCKKLFVDAKGMKNGSTRVFRRFPNINPPWECTLVCEVFDSDITNDVFERHLRAAGLYKGIGQFRPERGGYCGRFRVSEFKWTDNLTL